MRGGHVWGSGWRVEEKTAGGWWVVGGKTVDGAGSFEGGPVG